MAESYEGIWFKDIYEKMFSLIWGHESNRKNAFFIGGFAIRSFKGTVSSTWIANGTQNFKCRLYFLKFKCKFSQRYIANMIGAACNSRIPPTNLNAGLNFVHAKNWNHWSTHIWNLCWKYCSSKCAKSPRIIFWS